MMVVLISIEIIQMVAASRVAEHYDHAILSVNSVRYAAAETQLLGGSGMLYGILKTNESLICMKVCGLPVTFQKLGGVADGIKMALLFAVFTSVMNPAFGIS